MNQLLRDIRQSLRSLHKSPGYSVVAVLTLSLGIGATTAIYTLIQSVLLAPLPYPEPERLLMVQEKNPEAGFPRFSLSPPNFKDYREMNSTFSHMSASTGSSFSLSGRDEAGARLLEGRSVTVDYLRVLGVAPPVGRDLVDEDDLPGASPVILISHAVWESLGGSRDLVGQDLIIDGVPTTLIGILPRELPPNIDAIAPLRLDYEKTSRGGHWLLGLGRLKDGVSFAEAEQDLTTVSAQLAQTYPESNTGWSSLVAPLHQRIVENVETALWVLLAAVGLVLLIACANVANLTLARFAGREREVALRSSLGAGRGQLMRQMLTENVVLATISGTLGVLLAYAATRWLSQSEAVSLPRAANIAVDGSVLAFTLVASLASAFAFGFLPALQASRPDLSSTLKQGGRGHAGGHGRRLRDGLVLAEVALAVVILTGAGLLMRSFVNLLSVDPGFETDGLWTASLDLPDTRYGEEEKRAAFLTLLHERLSALPGVEDATTVFPMPIADGSWYSAFYLADEPPPPPNEERSAVTHFINVDYFATMGIPLLKGRGITARDHAEAEPVVVANASAARDYWPGEDPIGKRITYHSPDDEEAVWFTVVGVAADVHQSLDAEVAPVLYRSARQGTPLSLSIVLRSAGSPGALAPGLRQAVQEVDPLLVLEQERSGRALLHSSTAEPRFNASLLSLFGLLALTLAAIGVFGVVSNAVTFRRRELGVRVALGAQSREILRLILRSGMAPVLAGVGLGLVAAFAAARLLQGMVFGVGTGDPLTFLVVATVLTLVAAGACLAPAWRATRVDPMQVLNED